MAKVVCFLVAVRPDVFFAAVPFLAAVARAGCFRAP
jgi:hypothetical protein